MPRKEFNVEKANAYIGKTLTKEELLAVRAADKAAPIKSHIKYNGGANGHVSKKGGAA
jgi:hypothetical protein